MRIREHLTRESQYCARFVDGSLRSVYYDRPIPVLSLSIARSDVVKTKPIDGWRKPTAYEATVIDQAYWSGQSNSYSLSKPNDVNTLEGYYGMGNRVDDKALRNLLPFGNSKVQADVAAFAAVADKKGKLLESVAEAMGGIKTIRDNARMLALFGTSVAKRDWAAAARALGLLPKSRRARRARDRTVAAGGGLGSAWLNYSFGIKPIIDDMVFALIILGEDRSIRLKGVGYANLKPSKSIQTTKGSGAGAYGTGAWTTQYTRTIKPFAKTVLWYEVRASYLARHNELGLYNVPATAWALVPFSFVVDWVVPVQSILAAWTSDVGLTFKGGTHTRFVEIRDSGFNAVPVPMRGFGMDGFLHSTKHRTRSLKMVRTVYDKPPYPTTLYVKDPLSVWTAVTSLALLASVIKSQTKGQ